MQHFAVTFEVPDFEKFLANETSQDSEFNITLTHSPDSSVLFKQVTQLNAGSETSGLDLGSMGEVFKDMYWTVTVHVPQVMSTNGQKMDNSTVQWKIPMADVFTGKAPSELTMVYQPKGSIGGGIFGGSGNSNIVIWLVGAIVLLVIAGGAAYYFLVYRKRPAAVPAAYSAAPAMGSVPQQWNAQPPQTDLSQQWGPPPQQPDFPQQWDAQPPQAGLPPMKHSRRSQTFHHSGAHLRRKQISRQSGMHRRSSLHNRRPSNTTKLRLLPHPRQQNLPSRRTIRLTRSIPRRPRFRPAPLRPAIIIQPTHLNHRPRPHLRRNHPRARLTRTD